MCWELLAQTFASLLIFMETKGGPRRACLVLHCAERCGRMGLAPHAAVWHLFLPQTLGNGTAERLRLAVVELHPYCPELWGWEQERGTGQAALPACIVVPGRVSQESSGSGWWEGVKTGQFLPSEVPAFEHKFMKRKFSSRTLYQAVRVTVPKRNSAKGLHPAWSYCTVFSPLLELIQWCIFSQHRKGRGEIGQNKPTVLLVYFISSAATPVARPLPITCTFTKQSYCQVMMPPVMYIN